MRDKPFQSIGELDAYTGGPRIECLECGKWFKSLATHIRTHGMTHDDYRDKWAIPKRYALAGTTTREILSAQMRDMIDSGRVTYDHLADAIEHARTAGRRRKTAIDAERHAKRVAEVRPGDHHRLPPGSERANGRDADREREYQIAYRHREAGDPKPMMIYRAKYSIESHWTEDEKQFIRDKYPEWGAARCADLLHRSEPAVRMKAASLRVRHNSGFSKSNKFRWNPEEHDPILIEMTNSGTNQAEIANVIGTSVTTVATRVKILGLNPRRGRKRKTPSDPGGG